jgi:hypothetical protein
LTTQNIHNYIGYVIEERKRKKKDANKYEAEREREREKMNEIMINIASNAYFSFSQNE